MYLPIPANRMSFRHSIEFLSRYWSAANHMQSLMTRIMLLSLSLFRLLIQKHLHFVISIGYVCVPPSSIKCLSNRSSEIPLEWHKSKNKWYSKLEVCGWFKTIGTTQAACTVIDMMLQTSLELSWHSSAMECKLKWQRTQEKSMNKQLNNQEVHIL